MLLNDTMPRYQQPEQLHSKSHRKRINHEIWAAVRKLCLCYYYLLSCSNNNVLNYSCGIMYASCNLFSIPIESFICIILIGPAGWRGSLIWKQHNNNFYWCFILVFHLISLSAQRTIKNDMCAFVHALNFVSKEK